MIVTFKAVPFGNYRFDFVHRSLNQKLTISRLNPVSRMSSSRLHFQKFNKTIFQDFDRFLKQFSPNYNLFRNSNFKKIGEDSSF